MTTKTDLERTAIDLMHQISPGAYRPAAALSARCKTETGKTISRASKAALVTLVASLTAELAEIEAAEAALPATEDPYYVVYIDGITNSKIISGPYGHLRTARAETRCRHYGVRRTSEIEATA